MSYRPAEIQPGYGKRPSRGFDPWIAIAFLYPLTQLVWFDFFGQFYLTDFAGLALLLMMVQMPDARRRLGDIRFVLFLLGLWLFGQVATDLYRATSPENFLRGWGRIVFFGLQIVALWLFLPRKREYMIAYAFGLGIASIVGVPAQYEEYGWKFGYGFGLELIIAAATCLTVPFFGSLRRYAPWIFLAAAVLLLLKDARSMFAMSVIAGGICALALTLEKFPRLQKRINPLVFVSFLLVGIAATSLIATVYANAAESGMLGEKARIKYVAQSSGDVPLLLGGRPESLVSIIAIQDAPILGHGSWAQDRHYTVLYHTIRKRLGIQFPKADLMETGRIPAHSFFFGSWVEAGILGAVFWLYLFFLPMFAIYQIIRRSDPSLPLIAFTAVSLTWNIPFSPFGASERFTTAAAIVILFWALRAAGFDSRSLVPRRRGPKIQTRQYAPAE